MGGVERGLDRPYMTFVVGFGGELVDGQPFEVVLAGNIGDLGPKFGTVENDLLVHAEVFLRRVRRTENDWVARTFVRVSELDAGQSRIAKCEHERRWGL